MARLGGINEMSQNVNIQDFYLNQLRKEHVSLTVFLTNGFQLRGIIKAFDNFTVLLETEGKQQLLFKHAISTFRSEEHTSELQSRFDLVCRLLLEKKKREKHRAHILAR